MAAGRIVARSPLIVFTPKETRALNKTSLGGYLFYVKDGPANGAADYTALAIGALSFLNHSDMPNCTFELDDAASEVIVRALRRLARDEEMTIDYGEDAALIILHPAAVDLAQTPHHIHALARASTKHPM